MLSIVCIDYLLACTIKTWGHAQLNSVAMAHSQQGVCLAYVKWRHYNRTRHGYEHSKGISGAFRGWRDGECMV